jgi:hypothetical protein
MMEVQAGLKQNIIYCRRICISMITHPRAVKSCCGCRKKWKSRKTFVPKTEEVTGDGENCILMFHNLYFSPNITKVITARMMRSTAHVTHMTGKENGKTLRKHGRRRCKSNIEMHLKEI